MSGWPSDESVASVRSSVTSSLPSCGMATQIQGPTEVSALDGLYLARYASMAASSAGLASCARACQLT